MDIETKVQEILAEMSKGQRKYEEKKAKKQGFASIEAYIQNNLEAQFKSKITEDEKEKIIQLQNETKKAKKAREAKEASEAREASEASEAREAREAREASEASEAREAEVWKQTDRAGQPYFSLNGEFREGKLHGQGTVTWSAPHRLAGEKQAGEFREGKLHGQGTVTWSAPHRLAGEKQAGEFREGKLHGQGTVTWSAPHRLAGEIQVGEYREGKLLRGTITFIAPHQHAGVKYVGEFREGKLHGQGTVTWSAPTPAQLEKAQDLAREYVRKKYKEAA